MDTTTSTDDDGLPSAPTTTPRGGHSKGDVPSALERGAMSLDEPEESCRVTLGFRPFASRGRVVTTELVDELVDDGHRQGRTP